MEAEENQVVEKIEKLFSKNLVQAFLVDLTDKLIKKYY